MIPNKNEATVNNVPIMLFEPGPGKNTAIKTNRKNENNTKSRIFMFLNILNSLYTNLGFRI